MSEAKAAEAEKMEKEFLLCSYEKMLKFLHSLTTKLKI